MIIDAKHIEDGLRLEADVCIVGGGAAGIALALELSRRSLKTVLLEGGGFKPDPSSQSLYGGENVGLVHEAPEDSRSRFLGGSTNCWGGWCRPLDELDFETRDWVPNSGWPIRKRDLAPYYARAGALLETPEPDYSLAHWAPEIERLGAALMPLAGGDFVNVVDQLSPPTRMGRVFRERLRAAPNLKTFINANVTHVATDGFGCAAQGVEAMTLEGKRLSVDAQVTVLAAGGVENARLLLLSNQIRPTGLGNGRDLVGRYYMDHPRVQLTRVRAPDAARFRPLYDALLHRIHRGRGDARARLEIHLAPSADAQRRLALPNSRTYLVGEDASDLTKSFFALKRLRRALNGRRRFGYPLSRMVKDVMREIPALVAHAPRTAAAIGDALLSPYLDKTEFLLESVIEPVPNPDSRVTLSERRDRLGLNQVRIDWRVTEQDRDHIRRLDRLVVDVLRASGVAAPADEHAANVESPELVGCWHHMGTTRMHDDPNRGVVDADCRVHDVERLYIAGSSVFPTVGSDSPTINLVALALRLADRITRDFEAARYELQAPAPSGQADVQAPAMAFVARSATG
ncbi:FAD-dependent oxidoreductase [Methylocella sp.]|uniref:FAD-dependent oxidoreductase n=1 Tax=Methylocella sp. TaxID=1978226 RepID=UPI003783AE0B